MLQRLRQIFRPDPATRAAEFWRWFAANEQVYRELASYPEEEIAHGLKVLRKHLHAYDAHLEPLFGTSTPERHDLVISAGGLREHFPAARALAAAAPELPGWNVIALKPPLPEVPAVEVEGRRFDPALVTFAVVQVPDQPGALAVHVFHEPYPPEEQDLHTTATFLLLDALLGERGVAEDLDYAEARPVSQDVPADVLRPLAALPQVVAAHSRK